MGRVVLLKPFSRAWWACWHREVDAGRSVGFASAQAKRGRSWSVPRSERPSVAEIDRLVAVPVDGDGFGAWRAHFANRGIVLPRPDTARVVWLRSAEPVERAA